MQSRWQPPEGSRPIGGGDAWVARDGRYRSRSPAGPCLDRFPAGFRPRKLCKALIKGLPCKSGKDCSFAHHKDELHPNVAENSGAFVSTGTNDFYLTMGRRKKAKKVCPFARQVLGSCPDGNSCKLAHSLEEMDPTILKNNIINRFNAGLVERFSCALLTRVQRIDTSTAFMPNVPQVQAQPRFSKASSSSSSSSSYSSSSHQSSSLGKPAAKSHSGSHPKSESNSQPEQPSTACENHRDHGENNEGGNSDDKKITSDGDSNEAKSKLHGAVNAGSSDEKNTGTCAATPAGDPLPPSQPNALAIVVPADKATAKKRKRHRKKSRHHAVHGGSAMLSAPAMLGGPALFGMPPMLGGSPTASASQCSTICPLWLRGLCRFGSCCMYVHGAPNEPAPFGFMQQQLQQVQIQQQQMQQQHMQLAKHWVPANTRKVEEHADNDSESSSISLTPSL